LCSDLIRINTSNPTHPERPAADYVGEALREVGLDARRFEPAPGRTSLVARLPGRDPSLPPLLVHAHLDVVPAAAEEWAEDPFGGVIKDGYVWGRGAVDMKDMVAAILASVRRLRRTGRQPLRDIVLAFFADEEAGGNLGAGHIVTQHPEVFAGCRVAIGEVGGFSFRTGPGPTCYLVSSAEKGAFWARLTSSGQAGHGSMINDRNAVASLCRAITRIADHLFEEDITPTMAEFLTAAAGALGRNVEPVETLLDALGPLSRMVRAGLRDTVNPTSLSGGYKVNVVPSRAEATVDGRFIPEHGERFVETIKQLAGPTVDVETMYFGAALEFPWSVPIVDAIGEALRTEDPSAVVIPYLGTAFTDAKWLSKLGIACYGFCPLRLPDDLDFTALFHGVDERVPIDALHFSVAVLTHLLEHF
jgi:acetylornithine deacetylase/succinyl-diaminopimelate desuccinylase-like protein